MSASEELTLSLPAGMTQERSEVLDLEAVHCFRFASERWFTGAGALTKGSLMIAVGGFLFSQVSSTPNLMVQTAIVATLLVIGGGVFAVIALRDLLGSLTVDKYGYQGYLGLSTISGKWSDVTRWAVHESARSPLMPGLEIWTKKQSTPHSIPSDFLSRRDWRRVYRLLSALAPANN